MSVVTLQWINFHIPFNHSFIHTLWILIRLQNHLDKEIVKRQYNKSHTYTLMIDSN